MDKKIKAFVSSTFEDLKDHRSYVISRLRDAGVDVDPMEYWTADSKEPKQFSKDRIIGCDICILLVAFRRGYIPDGENESITQLEYRHSITLGIDVLPFLLKDGTAWPKDFDERDDDPGVKKWRDELLSKHGVGSFYLAPDSIKIESAIVRWLVPKGRKPTTLTTTQRSSPIVTSWTPDGRVVTIRVRRKHPKSAPVRRCLVERFGHQGGVGYWELNREDYEEELMPKLDRMCGKGCCPPPMPLPVDMR